MERRKRKCALTSTGLLMEGVESISSTRSLLGMLDRFIFAVDDAKPQLVRGLNNWLTNALL